jgi:hypothetical protein
VFWTTVRVNIEVARYRIQNLNDSDLNDVTHRETFLKNFDRPSFKCTPGNDRDSIRLQRFAITSKIYWQWSKTSSHFTETAVKKKFDSIAIRGEVIRCSWNQKQKHEIKCQSSTTQNFFRVTSLYEMNRLWPFIPFSIVTLGIFWWSSTICCFCFLFHLYLFHPSDTSLISIIFANQEVNCHRLKAISIRILELWCSRQNWVISTVLLRNRTKTLRSCFNCSAFSIQTSPDVSDSQTQSHSEVHPPFQRLNRGNVQLNHFLSECLAFGFGAD